MTLTQRNVLIFAGLIAYSLGLLLPAPFNGFVLLSGVMCAMIWGLNRVIQQDAAITGVQVQAQTRRRLSRVALLLSIILFVWMMWFLHPARLYIEARLALSLVLPVALLAYPVFRLYRPVPHQTTSVYTNSHRKIRPELIAAGIILLCLLTLSNILPFDMRVSPFLSQHVQILFFIIGLMLLVMGFAGLTRRDLWMVLTWRLPGMILLITGLAFVVRMWNLEFGVHRLVDEFHFMQAVGDLWNGGEQRMLLPHGGITAFTWLYPYMQWQTSMITGASLTGLRLASVLIGTMQIPVIYLLGRELFNRRVAVVAALMLAILPLHVQFSRIGLNNIVDPLVGMLAMFFLVRGMRRGYPVYFVLAGLCLGLTHYFYEGGKLFYTLFIVLWLIWIRVFKRHDDGFYLPTRRQLRLMGGVFLLTIMPVYFAWWVNLFPLTPRVNKTSDGSLSTNILAILGSKTPLEELIEVFEPYFLMYLYAIDVSDFFTNERFLSLAGTGFFVIGSIVAAYRLRFVSYALVFWWMMGVPIGLALTIGTKPEVPRYIVVLPALALLIAVGLDESLRLLHA
ncbi:MAG: glycosyltransferase family 39 protein, partial [Aggregatilineales bacterium]